MPESCRRLEENRHNSRVDLRAYRLFHTDGDYDVDSCPSSTQRHRRTFAINKQGLIIELLQTDNFTQVFYETTCIDGDGSEQQAATATATNTPNTCQFIDPLLAPHSRCVQQLSYVYAVGRLFGRRRDQFSLNYIRIPTGCKCQLSSSAVAAVQEDKRHQWTTVTPLLPQSMRTWCSLVTMNLETFATIMTFKWIIHGLHNGGALKSQVQ